MSSYNLRSKLKRKAEETTSTDDSKRRKIGGKKKKKKKGKSHYELDIKGFLGLLNFCTPKFPRIYITIV